MLIEILKRAEVESAIVFTRTRSRADRVARMIAAPVSRQSRFMATVRRVSATPRWRDFAIALIG